MKKKLSILMCLCILLSSLSFSGITTSAKPKKVTVPKPTLKSVVQLDTNTIKVKWSKVKSANKYQLYYKVSGGKYKRLKTLSKNTTSFTHKKLTVGKKYFYKVRAYKTVNGKKYYSKWSNQLAKKTSNYLMDLVKPYYVGNYNNWFTCDQYKSPNTFEMAGERFSNGFTLGSGGCNIIFNLKGKYRKISFVLGSVDDCERSFSILSDDSVVFSKTIQPHGLTKKYTIDIENASKLEFRDTSFPLTYYLHYIGIANIKLYK